MKILQINAVYGFRSTGLIMSDIENMLQKHGDEAYCVFQQAGPGAKITAKHYLMNNKADRLFHGMAARVTGKQAYASRHETKKMLRWLDRVRPDIVHLHNLHSNYICLDMLCTYLKEHDIPTVLTLHDCWFFTGKCSHFAAVGCERWMHDCGSCPQLKAEVPSLFFDNTAFVLKDKTDHLNAIPRLAVVGCSRWIMQAAERSKLHPSVSEVIYNGVDTTIFCPHVSDVRQKYGLGNKKIILGMADKWRMPRNEKAVRAVTENAAGDTAVCVVGCNDADKAYFSQFEKIISVPYIADRGVLSDLYAAADVFVNLTHADTLPTVNMEAICCGTPVITFDCCGSPELVGENFGYVVKEDDTDGLNEKIRRILTDGFAVDVEMAQRLYNKERNYEQYHSLYERLPTR